MIQRIQTVYLLTIVVLSSITLFSPVADLLNKADLSIYIIDYQGIFQVNPTGNIFQSNVWGLTAIAVMMPIISLITIFLYKRRVTQIRLSIFNMVVMVAYYGLLVVYLWFAGQNLHTEWSLRLVTAFPLVNIVLNSLAIRTIAKDEALVKSLNRLR